MRRMMGPKTSPEGEERSGVSGSSVAMKADGHLRGVETGRPPRRFTRVGDRRAVRGTRTRGRPAPRSTEARDACRASGVRDAGVGATTTRIIV
jgi:hypothetical protein